MKLKIGITGQAGFLGQHLYHSVGLFPVEFETIDFHRDFFDHQDKLEAFVKQCDVIVHLAAMNRHENPEVLYQTNITLVEILIAAMESTGSKPHVVFSSSSQEDRDNHYGRSKKEGQQLFLDWASRTGGRFTGLVVPNVFGPFGQPFYNSFVATFCHQLCNAGQPVIDTDGEVQLIYVNELVTAILAEIRKKAGEQRVVISHTVTKKVSQVLGLLERYKQEYFDLGVIPELNNSFEINLFNTFRSFINVSSHFPVKYKKHTDPRGSFVEVIRLNVGGQVSFSTTVPGVTRGNHYHTRKIERFSVIKGRALIQLRKIGTAEVFDFYLDGNEPAYVDMPVWYTHNIKNIGEEELYTNFWINEFYNEDDADTFMETV